jgi:hypothetical protein
MKLKVFLYSLIVVTLIGCAAKNIVEPKTNGGDLVEVFKLGDKKFDKFITKKKSTKEKVSDDLKESPLAKKKPNKKVTKKKATKKKAKKKIANKTQKKEEVKAEVKETKPEPLLPIDPQTLEDYPKSYLAYNKYKKYWDVYKPISKPGEKISLEISWTLFKAGVAVIETIGDLQIGDKDVIGYRATLESADYFENIYKLKDVLDSYISKETNLPVKYVLKQRESGQSVDDLQLFDHDSLKTYFWYNRLKKGKTKKRELEAYTPKYFMDSFSAVQFVRGLPLKVGSVFEFPVITRTKVWLFSAKVEGIETANYLGKDVKAFKIKAETKYPGVLKKKGDILLWMTADEKRVPLRLEAKIKIGTVKANLINYTPGK